MLGLGIGLTNAAVHRLWIPPDESGESWVIINGAWVDEGEWVDEATWTEETWLLSNGTWSDSGVWMDSSVWQDTA